ncbi:MAG: CPBP family intramembrane glutamic endopeptidase [Polyangiaceae bacterium]
MAVPDPGRPLIPDPGRSLKRSAHALAAAIAACGVLAITRALPGFSSLGPRGALFGWLASATAITLVLPAIVTFGVARVPLAQVGIGWGRARRDAVFLVGGVIVAIAIGAVLSLSPTVNAYYPRYRPVREQPLLWIPSTLAFAAYGLAWEALFRGHLLLALRREGDSAMRAARLVALQTAVFAIGHLDKPAAEAWLSIPAGIFLGALAWRTGSVLPGFLLHFAASTSVNLFCAYGRWGLDGGAAVR